MLEPSVTPGNIRLSWTEVTTTLDGDPADVSHYEVWHSPEPFTRTDVRDDDDVNELVSIIVQDTWIEFPEPEEDRYYSVLAVDVRGNKSPF